MDHSQGDSGVRRAPTFGERALAIAVGGPDGARRRVDGDIPRGGSGRQLTEPAERAAADAYDRHPVDACAVEQAAPGIESDLVYLGSDVDRAAGGAARRVD